MSDIKKLERELEEVKGRLEREERLRRNEQDLRWERLEREAARHAAYQDDPYYRAEARRERMYYARIRLETPRIYWKDYDWYY